MIAIANAPVSYGVFDLRADGEVPLPDGPELLALVRAAGYAGIDLGAHGLLGTGEELVANLRRHGLALAGGWLDYPFTADDERFDAAVRRSLPALRDFAMVATGQALPPRPTLADAGDDLRRAHPAGATGLQLLGGAWERFVTRLERVAELVRGMGLEPTFHHHVGTYIETPAEIEALLADSTVDLTFDTGHLLLGGGDPVRDFTRWAPRINHVHLKDASLAALEGARRAADPLRSVWESRAFVALGEGDLEFAAIVESLIQHGYSGWVVVEQDVVPRSDADVRRAIADQVANRKALRRWFG